MRPVIIYFQLTIIAFGLIFSACFEPKEGCLDVEATNFDAAADDDCCCEYPKIVLEVLHRYGNDSTQYLPGAVYEADNGQLFRIHSVVFYLSDFQLFQGNNAFTVSDTVQLQTYAPAGSDTLRETFTDDFLLVRRTPVSNEVGEFRPAGVFDKVKIRLGLSAGAQRVIPPLAPAGHPLRIQGDSLWYGPAPGYVLLQTVVGRDTISATKPDTLAFTKADFPDFFIETSDNFLHRSGGYDFTLKLKIDYKELFQGIDWTSGDIPAWKSQIVANLPSAFSVIP